MHAKEAPPAAASHSDKPGQTVSIQALQGNHGGVLDRGKKLNANLHYEWTRYDTSNELDHPNAFEYVSAPLKQFEEGNLKPRFEIQEQNAHNSVASAKKQIAFY